MDYRRGYGAGTRLLWTPEVRTPALDTLAKTGVRLLSRKTVELMTTNHIGDKPIWLTGPGYGFGLGYAIVTDQGPAATLRSEGSYFWTGAFGTVFWVDPKEELIGVMMEQIYPYSRLNIMPDMISMTYQAIVD